MGGRKLPTGANHLRHETASSSPGGGCSGQEGRPDHPLREKAARAVAGNEDVRERHVGVAYSQSGVSPSGHFSTDVSDFSHT